MREYFDVIKGAEPFFHPGNEIGVLISHGFMGTPQSVQYVGESLAQYGYTVLAPRLKGHGTHYLDLEKCTHEDWFNELEKGYFQLKQTCENIYILGQSMGGALALCLASKHKDISGIIVINAALSVPTYDYLRERTSPRYIIEGEPDIKAANVYEITYSKVPIKAVHELQKIMDISKKVIPTVHCPVLGIKSAIDHVAPPENTDFILQNISSLQKKLKILQNSYHVASMDHDKLKIVEYSQQFIEELEGKASKRSNRWMESV